MAVDAPFPSLGDDPWGGTIIPWAEQVRDSINDLDVTVNEGRLSPDQLSSTIGAEERRRESVFNILDYGARVDGREITVSMTAGSNAVTSADHSFAPGDVGKTIGIAGAGTVSSNFNTNANDGVLIATITGVTGGAATLSVPAVNTVSDATAVFGTPDDDAIAAAQTAAYEARAFLAGGGVVFFPPGRTIVTRPLGVRDYVTWAGVHPDVSWVEVIQDCGTLEGAWQTSWLHCSGRSAANPLTGAAFRDFGVNARFHIRSGGYLPSIKALNIFHVRRCSITNMNVWNTGGTAIPFDHQYESVLIAFNVVKNPGRLFPDTSRGGGSGIGIGTINTGGSEPGAIIGNTILGVGTADTAARGNNGIFMEAQGQSTTPANPAAGFRIIGNYISGMRVGIRDAGAIGSVISNNVIELCESGMRYDYTPVRGSYPGLDALVIGNTIRKSKTAGIVLTGDKDHGTSLRGRIVENNILDTSGRGIYVEAGHSPIEGLTIARNKIRGATRSGIYVGVTTPASYLDRPVFVENDISGIGTDGANNDGHGIYLNAEAKRATVKGNRVTGGVGGFRIGGTGALTEGGEVSGNDFGAASVAGTLETSVRVFGNLGWNTVDSQSVVIVRPPEFIDVNGSTTLGHNTRHVNRAFPSTATAIVSSTVTLPSDWDGVAVSVVYTAAFGSVQNVRWRADIELFSAGDAILAASPPSGTPVTAPIDNTVRVADVATFTTGGKRYAVINIARLPGDAADTLPADALLLGVQLRRTQ